MNNAIGHALNTLTPEQSFSRTSSDSPTGEHLPVPPSRCSGGGGGGGREGYPDQYSGVANVCMIVNRVCLLVN